MPSRVPLSKLAPAKYPFEREEKRPRRVELRQQPCAVVVDEALEERHRKMPRVLREQRTLHPVDHRVARFQDMRIDDQADNRIVEATEIQKACKPVRRQHRLRSLPLPERR